MEVLKLSVLGGALGLDGTAVGQFMVSRPLVAGVLAGWLLGAPEVGATVGALLELYLLVSVPSGGARFPEGSTATVVAVAVAAPSGSPAALAVGVAMGLLWGQVAGASVSLQRRVNGRIVPGPDDPGPIGRRLGRVHLVAILLDFARGAGVTLVGVGVGRAVLDLVAARWPLDGPHASAVLYAGGAVSMGILLHDLGGFRRRRLLFAAGLAVGILGTRLL